MDQLADAVAAGHATSPTDYAEYLLEARPLSTGPHAGRVFGDERRRIAVAERIVMLVESGLKLRFHCPWQQNLAIATSARWLRS